MDLWEVKEKSYGAAIERLEEWEALLVSGSARGERARQRQQQLRQESADRFEAEVAIASAALQKFVLSQTYLAALIMLNKSYESVCLARYKGPSQGAEYWLTDNGFERHDIDPRTDMCSKITSVEPHQIVRSTLLHCKKDVVGFILEELDKIAARVCENQG